MLKQTDQLFERRLAGQIDQPVTLDAIGNELRVLPLRRDTRDRARVLRILEKASHELRVAIQRPLPNADQLARVGIHDDEAFAGGRWPVARHERLKALPRRGINPDLRNHAVGGSRRRKLAQRHLGELLGRSLERHHECHERLPRVQVRVVADLVREEIACVETLLREPVEADARRGTAQVREDRAEPRERLEIDRGVDAETPRGRHESDGVANQRAQARGVDREHVRVGDDLQHLDAVFDLSEQKEEDLTLGMGGAEPVHGGTREHGRAHLGQFDEQHVARLRRRSGGS